MAVVGSGEIKLNGDVNIEINGSLGTNVSLSTLSVEAGKSAPHGLQEFYGYSSLVAPSVTTNAITGVTVTNMTLNGNVTSDGGGTVTQRGFYFGTSSNITSNPKYAVGSGTGAFSLNRGVTGSTTYYCAAYAINAAGESRGATTSATSQAAIPVAVSYNQSVNYLGWNGHAGNMAQNQGVYVSYFHQYQHPNYGFTTDFSTMSQAQWPDYNAGAPSGYTQTTVGHYYRTDTGASLCNRTYGYGELSGWYAIVDWPNYYVSNIEGGAGSGAGCASLSPQRSANFANGWLGQDCYSASYGGGNTNWGITGPQQYWGATGYIDTRY